MQLLTVTNLPIYLPADHAPVPFGDPLTGVTATLASPGVVSVVGYDNPVNGDAISFSIPAGSAGVLPVASPPITVGTVYYVVNASIANNTATFNISATKGGAAINFSAAASGVLTAHLLSNQFYGVTLPFKPSNTVLLQGTAGLILQGAPDVNVNGVYGSYGNPGGPGTWATLATIPASGSILVNLTADWIRISTNAAATLIQN